jgi:uncharacterized protein (DUF433 family)
MKPIEPKIIDRGRGPEIAGTRITVYDVMDYYKHGDHHSVIATILGVSSAEILCAIEYIEEHKAEVEAAYQRILDRHARGNPPEVQKKLDEAHDRFMKKIEQRRRVLAQEQARAEADG